ncbi:MAG: HAMP domain-containing protein [Elusimicrobia bacterium]|nr:HAMP domain-containing protein [Elusimicrobiota bacterium]
MRRLRLRLYPKFMLLLVSLAAAPVALVGYQMLDINREGLETAVLELHTKLADQLAQRTSLYISQTDEKFRFVLSQLESNVDWRQKQRLLQSLLDSQPDLEGVAVLDIRGMELLKVYDPKRSEETTLRSHAQTAAFRRFLKQPQRVLELHGASAQSLELHFYYPLLKRFVFFASLSMDEMEEKIRRERVGGTGFAFLVDASGRPRIYPSEQLPQEVLPTVPQWRLVREAVSAVGVGSSEYTDPTGREQVGAYAPIQALEAAVLIQQPKEEAYWALKRMRSRALGVLLGVIILAVAVAYLLARQLSRPILEISRAAQAVAGGDFSQQTSVRTQDELQDLGETFNEMVARLREYAEIQIDRLITEKTKTEAILFSIVDAIVVTDYQGHIQLLNRKARYLFGLSPEAPVENRSISELVSHPQVRAVLEEVSKEPRSDLAREIEISSKNLRNVYQVSAQPVITPGHGLNLGVVMALHDVTLEREMDRMKEEFLHSITHDLRNPMTSVRGFIQFLLDGIGGPLTESQRKMLSSMDKASFRLLAMINDILDIAKLEAGRMELTLKECRLGEIAGRVVEMLEPISQKKRIEVLLSARGEGRLVADENLLERVLMNLVGNAVKFTPEEGRVTLHLEEEEGLIRVMVADTGEGIPAEYLDKIFDKFQQVAGQRRGGTGLGLTICKHIVEAHGGKIWAESELQRGSRFILELPKKAVALDPGSHAALTDPRTQ